MNKAQERQHFNPSEGLSPTHNYEIFQHQYFFELEDKVYASKLENLEIKSLCMNNYGEARNIRLAGDLQDEFAITDPYTMKCVEEELSIHLSRMYQRKVKRLSFINQENSVEHLWINFQRPTEYNPRHVHSGFFSFVIYVSIPEEIRQEYLHAISNPNGRRRGMIEFSSKRTNNSLVFNPQTDDILVFHADHQHQVYPFYSDNLRVTVSGNVHQIEWED
jgi:hypothetical protein